ncbi:MazG nucleotide pyrophosphohydrolase [Natrialba aegyptia DSM 13077]|uniref:MazG nucleotide pyrophosphohydrolase n=1 Tax=Natrialba aegyptia DSM 13077 TaxID=1227491 RepID=M0B880_9EURY|nr:MazG nucleotide pyrophosphohydrolase [Natrialba aegyptia DSM 13077]
MTTQSQSQQDRVAAFIDRHDLETPPAFRLLDLTSEVGELGREDDNLSWQLEVDN